VSEQVELIQVDDDHFKTPNGEFSIRWEKGEWYVREEPHETAEDKETEGFWMTASSFEEAVGILENQYRWQMGGNREFVLPESVDWPRRKSRVASPRGGTEARTQEVSAADRERTVAEVRRRIVDQDYTLFDEIEPYLDDPEVYRRVYDLLPPGWPPPAEVASPGDRAEPRTP
jgi:hypothetical protein